MTSLTVRDHFACLDFECNFPNIRSMADFLGVECPDTSSYQAVAELSFKAESKLRYMRADAMMEERKLYD